MDLSFLRSIFKTTLLFVGVALIQAAADSPADGSAIAEAIPQPNLAGFVLRNQYTDFTCVSDPLGTSGTALNSCLPQSANPSTNYTMTFSDIDCLVVTTSYFRDDACTEFLYSTTENGLTCSNGSLVSGAQSEYTFCSFEVPLPTLKYSNVMLAQYLGTTGCNLQPDSIYAYPLDTCVNKDSGSSAVYQCDGSTPTYTTYKDTGCSASDALGTAILSDLCLSTTYTNDDTSGGTVIPYYGTQDVQYVCEVPAVGGDDDKLSDGDIAGIVIGVLLFFTLLVAAGWFVLFASRRCCEQKEDQTVSHEQGRYSIELPGNKRGVATNPMSRGDVEDKDTTTL